MILLLSGVVVTQDADKSEILNAFLPVCITSRICFKKSQALGPVGASGAMQAYPQFMKTFKQTGHKQVCGTQWAASTSAEGAGRCHGKTSLMYI